MEEDVDGALCSINFNKVFKFIEQATVVFWWCINKFELNWMLATYYLYYLSCDINLYKTLYISLGIPLWDPWLQK